MAAKEIILPEVGSWIAEIDGLWHASLMERVQGKIIVGRYFEDEGNGDIFAGYREQSKSSAEFIREVNRLRKVVELRKGGDPPEVFPEYTVPVVQLFKLLPPLIEELTGGVFRKTFRYDQECDRVYRVIQHIATSRAALLKQIENLEKVAKRLNANNHWTGGWRK